MCDDPFYSCPCECSGGNNDDYYYSNLYSVYCEICGEYLETICENCDFPNDPSLCGSEGCLEFWKLKNA